MKEIYIIILLIIIIMIVYYNIEFKNKTRHIKITVKKI